MKLRLSTKKLILTALAGAFGMFIICCGIFYLGYNKFNDKELALKNEYQQKVKELSAVADQSMQAYALNQKVDPGQKITSNMLTEVFVPEAAYAINSLTPVQVDTKEYFAKAEFQPNTPLVEAMVYEEEYISNDIREMEYGFIQLPSKLKKDDYVDVRIQFPTGEDFVLFAKKKVKDVQGVTLWLNNDEGEILTMSSAMVDAFLNEGKIYATTYVDGEMQNGLQMTYPVNEAVRSLIVSSPNVVNIAKLQLEKQNRAVLESNLSIFGEEQAKKVRDTENQFNSVKEMEDKERSLIQQNSNSGYSTELVNPEFGEGENMNE